MGTNRADDGMSKPTIHVSKTDAEIAEALQVGGKSPSTVYSEALENWQELEELKQKKKELQERYPDISLPQLLELWNMIPED